MKTPPPRNDVATLQPTETAKEPEILRIRVDSTLQLSLTPPLIRTPHGTVKFGWARGNGREIEFSVILPPPSGTKSWNEETEST